MDDVVNNPAQELESTSSKVPKQSRKITLPPLKEVKQLRDSHGSGNFNPMANLSNISDLNFDPHASCEVLPPPEVPTWIQDDVKPSQPSTSSPVSSHPPYSEDDQSLPQQSHPSSCPNCFCCWGKLSYKARSSSRSTTTTSLLDQKRPSGIQSQPESRPPREVSRHREVSVQASGRTRCRALVCGALCLVVFGLGIVFLFHWVSQREGSRDGSEGGGPGVVPEEEGFRGRVRVDTSTFMIGIHAKNFSQAGVVEALQRAVGEKLDMHPESVSVSSVEYSTFFKGDRAYHRRILSEHTPYEIGVQVNQSIVIDPALDDFKGNSYQQAAIKAAEFVEGIRSQFIVQQFVLELAFYVNPTFQKMRIRSQIADSPKVVDISHN